MELLFLGTGTSQGVPVISCECETCKSTDTRDKRLRSSVLLKFDNKCIVIDAGPDFRQQMLRENIKHIDAVLITHQHKDHVGGLDDIRPFNFNQNKALDIFAEKRVHSAIKKEFSYAFKKDAHKGMPQMNLIEISNSPFRICNQEITPIRVMHLHLPIFGYRIGDLVYITDASYIKPNEIEKIKGCSVLIVNALMENSHYSHFNLKDALELIKKINPPRAYLTHVSHKMGKYIDIKNKLPECVHFAYDGLKISI